MAEQVERRKAERRKGPIRTGERRAGMLAPADKTTRSGKDRRLGRDRRQTGANFRLPWVQDRLIAESIQGKSKQEQYKILNLLVPGRPQDPIEARTPSDWECGRF